MPIKAAWGKARAWFVHLLHLNDSPHAIALGAALGVLLSFTPTVGLQMLLIFFIASLLRANTAAAVPMAWVTNPATMVPIYSLNYLVGSWIAGASGPSPERFEAAVHALVSRDVGWWPLVRGLWDLALEVAVPLWVGGLLLGIIAAAITYVVFYRAVVVCRRLIRREARQKREAGQEREPVGTAVSEAAGKRDG